MVDKRIGAGRSAARTLLRWWRPGLPPPPRLTRRKPRGGAQRGALAPNGHQAPPELATAPAAPGAGVPRSRCVRRSMCHGPSSSGRLFSCSKGSVRRIRVDLVVARERRISALQGALDCLVNYGKAETAQLAIRRFLRIACEFRFMARHLSCRVGGSAGAVSRTALDASTKPSKVCTLFDVKTVARMVSKCPQPAGPSSVQWRSYR